jgi:hypothetical protein
MRKAGEKAQKTCTFGAPGVQKYFYHEFGNSLVRRRGSAGDERR